MIPETPTRPLVFAHRGASADAPGNTLDAFRLAVQHGADGVELDVRLTADGIVIVHHEPGAHDHGLFAELDFEALRRELPHIPTLDEVAAVVGDLLVDVEIKNDPRQPDHDPAHHLAEIVAAWVENGDRYDRVLVSSFNPRTIDRVRACNTRIATGQVLGRLTDLGRHIASVAARGHSWIIPHVSHLRRKGRAKVAAAHREDLRLAVWTVDSVRHLRQVRDAGVDAVLTDHPARAVDVYSPP